MCAPTAICRSVDLTPTRQGDPTPRPPARRPPRGPAHGVDCRRRAGPRGSRGRWCWLAATPAARPATMISRRAVPQCFVAPAGRLAAAPPRGAFCSIRRREEGEQVATGRELPEPSAPAPPEPDYGRRGGGRGPFPAQRPSLPSLEPRAGSPVKRGGSGRFFAQRNYCERAPPALECVRLHGTCARHVTGPAAHSGQPRAVFARVGEVLLRIRRGGALEIAGPTRPAARTPNASGAAGRGAGRAALPLYRVGALRASRPSSPRAPLPGARGAGASECGYLVLGTPLLLPVLAPSAQMAIFLKAWLGSGGGKAQSAAAIACTLKRHPPAGQAGASRRWSPRHAVL